MFLFRIVSRQALTEEDKGNGKVKYRIREKQDSILILFINRFKTLLLRKKKSHQMAALARVHV